MGQGRPIGRNFDSLVLNLEHVFQSFALIPVGVECLRHETSGWDDVITNLDFNRNCRKL